MKVKEISIEQWQNLISKFPQATLFHATKCIQGLRKGFPHVEVRPYAILNEENEVIGLSPLGFTQKGPFKILGSPLPLLFTPYQLPLLQDFSCIALDQVLKLTVEMFKPRYFVASFPPDMRNIIQSNKTTMRWKPPKILVNLPVGAEKPWKGLKAQTRNQVRQAERQGVEACEPKSIDKWLKDYYEMHKKCI